MAITQLGLHGPQMAYAGFAPKAEAISDVANIDITGTYEPDVAITGVYALAIEVTGEWETD